MAVRRAGQAPRERGGGSILVLAVAIALILIGVVAAWQLSWLGSGGRARSTADLVALAAASAQQQGRPACDVADRVAVANHAELISCAVTTGWGEFVVDVEVTVDAVPRIPGAPDAMTAESRAGVVDLGAENGQE